MKKPPHISLRTSTIRRVKRRISAPTLEPPSAENMAFPLMRDYSKYTPYDLTGKNAPYQPRTPRRKKDVF